MGRREERPGHGGPRPGGDRVDDLGSTGLIRAVLFAVFVRRNGGAGRRGSSRTRRSRRDYGSIGSPVPKSMAALDRSRAMPWVSLLTMSVRLLSQQLIT